MTGGGAVRIVRPPLSAAKGAADVKVTYNEQYERHLKTCFIGCGGHACRNIYPTFQYAPVDLAAVCDLDAARAAHVARQFGARAHYTDHRAMLDRERPEVVFIVTNYDKDAKPRYPQLACDAMHAGAHVWIEKPPAGCLADVEMMMETSRKTGKWVMCGFKKMFFPANVRAHLLSRQEWFGGIRTITARYPQHLPGPEERDDPWKLVGFLDHIGHPHSLLRLLGGPLESIYVERQRDGAAVSALRFKSGAVGTLHLCPGIGGGSPLEHTEIVGEHGNVIVENNIRVYCYSGGGPEGGYGVAGDFTDTGERGGAQFWEPEFSLGQLYNKGLFLLGYAPEVISFCKHALAGIPPEKADLECIWEMTRIYEAYLQPTGQVIKI